MINKRNKQNSVFEKQSNPYLKWSFYLFSIFSVLFVWWFLASVLLKNNRLVASPIEVFSEAINLLKTATLWRAILNTLLKTLIGFSIAFLLGIILSIISSRFVFFKYYLDPIISILRSFPTLAISLVLLMWLNGDIASIVIGFMIVFPIIYTTIYEAINGINKNLIIMAKTYSVKSINVFWGVTMPAIFPYIFSATLSGFTLNLKVVIATEIISLPSNSIGLHLVAARNSYEYSTMFAWVIIAILLSFACEITIKCLRKVCLPWEKKRQQAQQKP